MIRNILVYSHDTYGLGNIRRNHALARHLADRHTGTQVLIVTSSRWFHMLPPHPSIKVVKLPEIERTVRGGYQSRSSTLDLDSVLRLRGELLRGAVRGFRPDLFLVDKVPLGLGGELEGAHEELSRTGCRSVLVLRDVLDDADRVRTAWRASGQYEALRHSFSEAWVLGDAAVYPTAAAYGLDEVPELGIRYCGYLRGRSGGSPRRSTRSDRFLVTVGGGADGAAVLDATAEALEAKRALPGLDVVLGPFLPASERQHIRARLRRHREVRVAEYLTDLPARIRDAAGVICMGGYNTVCEVLSSQTPALVVPRRRPGREQVIRARRMEDLGYFRSAADSDDRPALVEQIREFLHTPPAGPFPRPDLNGLLRAGMLARG